MKRVVISILFFIGSIRAMDVCEVPNLDVRFMLKFREAILCEFDHHAGCRELQSAFQAYRDALCPCPKTIVRRAICSKQPREVLLSSEVVAELKRTHDLNLWEKDASQFEMIVEYGRR